VLIPETGDAGAEQAEVASSVNVCPRFAGSLVMPQRILPDESAFIAVRAVDPDALDTQLAFSWTATSGTFTASDKSVTNYRCAQVGSEQLTVVARDHQGCTSELTIAVECIDH